MYVQKNHTGSQSLNAFFFVIFLFFLLPCSVFAQSNSAKGAGRQTALRCLQLAKDYINKSEWSSADPQIELGLAYDGTVSDLWYLKAVVKAHENAAKAEILPLVQHALAMEDWVDYNRSSARILYADILSDTGFYDQALSVLDGQPFLYSADAEYIRVKSYYRLHTDESHAKARDKIDAVRRIYPSDSRFARLFLRNEYALWNGREIPPDVRRIADFFIASVPRYADTDSELQLYAALFANDEERFRMLKAYQAKNMRHPLFASAALKAGLMTQKEALEYFISFADTSISLENLESFAVLLTEDDAKSFLSEYLTAYNGILTADTDGDLDANLFVGYLRGRPQSLRWDKDNDGIDDWTAVCDFGVPQTVVIPKEKIEIGYGTYPYITKVTMQNPEGHALFIALADEQFSWTPFDIAPLPQLKENPGCDFYVPQVRLNLLQIDESQILSAALSYDIDSAEYSGAKIHFSLLNGIPQTADYTRDGKLYAQTFFENGLPVTRTVDKDGDRIFETTETYGYDIDNKMNVTEAENRQIMVNVYGIPAENTQKLYVKMIRIDQNADTLLDFTEEYLPLGGKITSWDSDNDGQWDMRYVRYPQKPGENLLEDSMFYIMPGKELTVVSCVDGEPVKVTSGAIEYTVIRGDNDGFFWVGKIGTPADERLVFNSLSAFDEQGRSVIASDSEKRILAVRIGKKYFARIIEPETDAEIESASGNAGAPAKSREEVKK